MRYDLSAAVESVGVDLMENPFSPTRVIYYERLVNEYTKLLKPDFVTLISPKDWEKSLYEKNYGLDFGDRPETVDTLIDSLLPDQVEMINRIDGRTFQFLIEDAEASMEKSFELRCNVQLIPGEIRTVIRRGIVMSVDERGVPEMILICVNDVTRHSQSRRVAFDVRVHNLRTKAEEFRLSLLEKEIGVILNSFSVDITNRELEILQAIARGQTSKAIAKSLNIAKSTVDTHRQNMIRKFDAPNMTALIQIAKNQGYL